MTHFLYVPFTGLGAYGGFRGNKWLSDRIRVFKSFVIPSLLNQTKKEFILWLSFRPEEKENPIVKELQSSLAGIRGLTSVFTFHGLCFYDDKLPKEQAKAKLIRNLGATLPELAPYVNGGWVYMTIQPSDDMYCSAAVSEIQSVIPGERCTGWRKGFIMNYATKEVAEYNPETLPPFTTIIFPKEKFLEPWAHFNYTGPYESHEFVKDYLPYIELEGRGFCVGTHGQNISTTFIHPYKGREILGAEKESIWLDYGCWDADPVIIHVRMRLWGRIILNLLPRPLQEKIRIIYHTLRAYVRPS